MSIEVKIVNHGEGGGVGERGGGAGWGSGGRLIREKSKYSTILRQF